MNVVSNTSPLIFLGHVNRLNLLLSCFSQVIIPRAVEVEFGDYPLPDTFTIHSLSTAGKTWVNSHYGALHKGELEAIQLADEMNADLVLLDDLLARKKAKQRGIEVMGTLGIFLYAVRQGHLPAKVAEQEIDRLVNEHDMYIAARLLKNVKRELKALE